MPAEPQTLLPALIAALGETAVIAGDDRLGYYAADVYRTGGLPVAVIRPTTVAALQEAVGHCAAAGTAMIPRGGGASYTDGYVRPEGGHVLVDTGALDSIDIDETNCIVTVGAGTTWANLKAALDARGLRTPFWGPFSGLAATVGGSVSQNTLSHGSSAHGISAQSVLSLDVVLASGELLSTSTAQALRCYGPDLTGLFTGDCGALGIKVAVRLPLLPLLPHAETLSFAFDRFADFHAAARRAQQARLDDSWFALDMALSQGQIARQEGMGARLQIAAEVLRKAPDKVKGLAQIMKMALAGENPMRAGDYMMHFIVEGIDPADAAHKARHLRRALAGTGREIANTVPAFVRSLPFAPLFNILGPGGERWVPLHGVLAHDQAVPFDAAFKALVASHKPEMDRLGVWLGTMFSPAAQVGFLYEIALYWPDSRNPYHETTLGADYLAGVRSFPANDASRAFVERLKGELVDLFQQHGAGHFQIGRAYPYQQRLSPPAGVLLRAIKAALDPRGLMNPGVLGL